MDEAYLLVPMFKELLSSVCSTLFQLGVLQSDLAFYPNSSSSSPFLLISLVLTTATP